MTNYQCGGIKCRCIPGRMLCGESGSIDISDFLTQEVKGPGKFKCTETEDRVDKRERSCSFEEPALNDLITSFFGDPYIEVDCMSGECMHYSQVPGFVRPAPGLRFGTTFMIVTASAAIVLVVVILSVVMLIARRQDSSRRGGDRGKYDQLIRALLGEEEGNLSIAEQDELRRSLLMAGHKPMTLAWKNVSYSVELSSARSGANWIGRLGDPRRWFGGQARSQNAVSNSAPFVEDDDDQPLVAEGMENGLQAREPSDGSLTILEGVNGIVRPGQVCAIMGGSGAGKTTFLDILARRNKAGLVGGEITINGRPITADDYKRSIG